MTSRRRVLAALDHREPDRVPIDLGGLAMTSMHRDTYTNLLRHLGLNEEITLVDEFQRAVKISRRVNERFHGDTWLVGPRWLPWRPAPGGRRVDEWGIHYASPPGSLYWEMTGHPLTEAAVEDLDRYPWPDPRDPARFEGLEEGARWAHEHTDYAVICGGYGFKGGLMGMPGRLRGHVQWYMDLAADDALARALLDRLLDFWLILAEETLRRVGRYVTAVAFNDDLGAQDGPLISPETYRRLIKPRQKILYDRVRQLAPQARLILHSCGSIYRLIPDLLEIGIDALNPIQLTARDMDDTARLKRQFGDRLTFWGGGCDTHRILPEGSVEEIRAEVARRIRDLAPGGGFVFAPVHNIQPDVSPEKICALYDAARELGRYPLAVGQTS